MENLKTPVAFIIFNRPDTTLRVFEEIRRARPLKLLVVADGPRPDRPGESERCEAVRSIISRVDWPCDVSTNYSDVNLGCKRRVSSGLDWIFSLVEEAIILEDDCLPDPTFFPFCSELLEKYRDDERIMVISGDNFQFHHKRTNYSYYFSDYVHVWGWASWRRAWKKYDVNIGLWQELQNDRAFHQLFPDRRIVRYWESVFEKTYRNEIDTWDYQWLFACLIHHGLSIMPNRNLVSNIGFANGATHPAAAEIFSDMARYPMQFPLAHPPYVIRDRQADAYTERTMFLTPFFKKVTKRLRRLLA